MERKVGKKKDSEVSGICVDSGAISCDWKTREELVNMNEGYNEESMFRHMKFENFALAGCPVHREVADWIPGHSTYLGCGFAPRLGHLFDISVISIAVCLSVSVFAFLLCWWWFVEAGVQATLEVIAL